MEAREFIEIGGTIRVENGPARIEATATPDLLASLPRYTARDSRGHPVVMGQPMEYLDWDGPWVWYISKLDGDQWEPAGVEKTKEAALNAVGES